MSMSCESRSGRYISSLSLCRTLRCCGSGRMIVESMIPEDAGHPSRPERDCARSASRSSVRKVRDVRVFPGRRDTLSCSCSSFVLDSVMRLPYAAAAGPADRTQPRAACIANRAGQSDRIRPLTSPHPPAGSGEDDQCWRWFIANLSAGAHRLRRKRQRRLTPAATPHSVAELVRAR